AALARLGRRDDEAIPKRAPPCLGARPFVRLARVATIDEHVRVNEHDRAHGPPPRGITTAPLERDRPTRQVAAHGDGVGLVATHLLAGESTKESTNKNMVHVR